ncbi:hypothetical protein AA106556_0403 [Neokomagataea tanensis NBRC 106556]|uniref:Uncharacterized protein n=1 Tax=Neokomagataea tanensis NBRC 106556 TaxID=1223519 RepID=A0ABQ0QGY7_9PROT|nr:hypothetical protein AA106556_0403 [Neokomagataea tanensis NBRC 106556]
MSQMVSVRWFFEEGEASCDNVIQRGWIWCGGQHGSACELFCDGAHTEQGRGREGNAALRIGIAPTMSSDDFATVDDGNGPSRSGVTLWEGTNGSV